MGISTNYWVGQEVNIFSVSSPDGTSSEDPFISLFSYLSVKSSIIGGDFNAHHSSWTSHHRNNNNGLALSSILFDSSNWILITLKDLPTRLCNISGKPSTIDLTFVSADLAPLIDSHVGPFWSSDHFPIFLSFSFLHSNYDRRRPIWIFRDKLWSKWNELVSNNLNSVNFVNIRNPADAYALFYEAIMYASNALLSPSLSPSPTHHPSCKSSQPWWNSICRKAVAAARKAFSLWKRLPTPENKSALNRLNAIMKRPIASEKNKSWLEFANNLCPRVWVTKVWKFARSMFGINKSSLNDWEHIPPLDDLESNLDKSQRIANLFLDQFTAFTSGSSFSSDPASEAFESAIDYAISDPSLSPLNSPFLREELIKAIIQSKSNAMGSDRVHLKMLKNLNPQNISNLLS